MYEKINKIISMINDVAPSSVINQLVDLRKQTRFQKVTDYEVISILNSYADTDWASKALEVIVGPKPAYDPSRETVTNTVDLTSRKDELDWCRANAPDTLKGCPDDVMLHYMHDAYVNRNKYN